MQTIYFYLRFPLWKIDSKQFWVAIGILFKYTYTWYIADSRILISFWIHEHLKKQYWMYFFLFLFSMVQTNSYPLWSRIISSHPVTANVPPPADSKDKSSGLVQSMQITQNPTVIASFTVTFKWSKTAMTSMSVDVNSISNATIEVRTLE